MTAELGLAHYRVKNPEKLLAPITGNPSSHHFIASLLFAELFRHADQTYHHNDEAEYRHQDQEKGEPDASHAKPTG